MQRLFARCRVAVIAAVVSAACFASHDDPPAGWTEVAAVATPRSADLLLVVDNSGSMAQEQQILRYSLPALVEALLAPADEDGDGRPDRRAVESLNLGVTSTDLGTGGFRVTTCANSDVGDDGCLLAAPVGRIDCEGPFPRFLSSDEADGGSDVPAALAQNLGCLTTLGTQGCGFEQPLGAAARAITTNARPGQCNAGFLRDGATLAVVWITDENDCTVLPEHPEMFDPDITATLGHLSLRCFLHPDMQVPVEAIAEDLRRVHPGSPDAVVLGVLAGMPPDSPACTGSGSQAASCLAATGMQARVDPEDGTQMLPSCATERGYAYPPIRPVQLAGLFRDAAVMGSICESDFRVLMRGVGERTTERLGDSLCLESEPAFPSEVECRVSCLAVETLADDRPCREDPECPAEGCPAGTVAEARAGRLEPCTVGGVPCEPLRRDLGLDLDDRRLCLLRQAERARDPMLEGRCGAAGRAGWYYVPPAEGRGESPCPRLVFPVTAEGPLAADGAAVRVWCAPGEGAAADAG